MAMFGFVYLWYLMAVLLLEIWLDYRKDIVRRPRSCPAGAGSLYRVMTLGVYDVTEESLRIDDKVGRFVTIIGIPSAFLLHGYVGFIFGSIKANPWWSTPLMPIVFLFSAIVSGIALRHAALHGRLAGSRGPKIDMPCVDTIARYLLYAFLIDFSLEMLDLHPPGLRGGRVVQEPRLHGRTRSSTSRRSILQIFFGTLIPIRLLGLLQLVKLSEPARKGIYIVAGILTLIGIFAMRWNVVIGGQLFSKSFLGYTTYKMGFATREGLLPAIIVMLSAVRDPRRLVELLPPWDESEEETAG